MIQLDNNYRIETDANNYTLIKEENTGEIHKETGKETISKDQWYFPKLNQCLSKYLNESVKGAESVKELLEKVNEVEAKINKKF